MIGRAVGGEPASGITLSRPAAWAGLLGGAGSRRGSCRPFLQFSSPGPAFPPPFPPPAPQDQHHHPHQAPPNSAKSLPSLSLNFLSCKVDKVRAASGRFHDARQASPGMRMAFRGTGLQNLKVQQGRRPRARPGEPARSLLAPDTLRRTRAIEGTRDRTPALGEQSTGL